MYPFGDDAVLKYAMEFTGLGNPVLFCQKESKAGTTENGACILPEA